MKSRYTFCVTATAISLISYAHAATASKGTTDGANWSATTAGAWTGGYDTNGAPASGDDVLIGSTSVNPTSNVIGGNLSWNKITIDRSTLDTFANSAGSTLNLGSGGITVTSSAAAGSGTSGVQLSAALSLVDQTWTILSTTGGITGFKATDFSIYVGANNGAGGFSNALDGGSFSIVQIGNILELRYTVIPEPTAVLLSGLELLTLLHHRCA